MMALGACCCCCRSRLHTDERRQSGFGRSGNQEPSMNPTITAFERSPDRGGGLARDMRVRWALEEVGEPYDVRLVSFSEMKEPAHRALHPFGQIPTYEEGDLALFESGAIVFHIAERHAGLLPDDANARARAITWMFAALSTVEPPIVDLRNRHASGARQDLARRAPAGVEDRIRDRLGDTFRSPRRCRLARGCVQRGRPADGACAAKTERIGNPGGISEPLGLCTARCGRRAARRVGELEAGFAASSRRCRGRYPRRGR